MNATANPSITQTPPQYFLPPASKLFAWALSYYRSHFSLIFGVSIIPFLLDAVQVFVSKNAPLLLIPLAIIASIVAFISRLALFGAVVEEGQTVNGAYKKGIDLLIPSIWISALFTLTTLGGTFLLLIPGLLLSIWLSFSLYILFAENRRGISAMARSWYYVKGYWLSVFWRFLFLGIILLIVSLTIAFATIGTTFFSAIKSGATKELQLPLSTQLIDLFFTNLIAIPFSIIYSFGIYSALRQIKKEVPAEADEQKLQKNISIFMVVGIIGLIAIIVFAGFLLVKFYLRSSPLPLNIPISLRILVSSMLASMTFSPFLDFLAFVR